MKKSAERKQISCLHYPTYSEEDEKLGMVCITAGTCEVAPNTVYPPQKNEHPLLFRPVAEGRTLPDFQIVYITKGQGIFNAEGVAYTVNPGSMFLILPELRHSYKPVFEIGWHEYWVGFNGSFFRKLVREGILSKEHLFFEMGLHEQYVTIFDRILEEVRTQRPLYQFKAELRKAGVSDYSIYLDDKTGTLFAVQRLADDATDSELPKHDVVKKWWRMMKDIMDVNPDESPVCDPLEEMFHMD